MPLGREMGAFTTRVTRMCVRVGHCRLTPEGTGAGMNEHGERPAHEPEQGQGTTTEDAEVRVTMERTRQALESSGAEVERSKRLLRETEELVGELDSSSPKGAADEAQPSGAAPTGRR